MNSKDDADKYGKEFVAVTIRRRIMHRTNQETIDKNQNYNYHSPPVRISP